MTRVARCCWASHGGTSQRTKMVSTRLMRDRGADLTPPEALNSTKCFTFLSCHCRNWHTSMRWDIGARSGSLSASTQLAHGIRFPSAMVIGGRECGHEWDLVGMAKGSNFTVLKGKEMECIYYEDAGRRPLYFTNKKTRLSARSLISKSMSQRVGYFDRMKSCDHPKTPKRLR